MLLIIIPHNIINIDKGMNVRNISWAKYPPFYSIILSQLCKPLVLIKSLFVEVSMKAIFF